MRTMTSHAGIRRLPVVAALACPLLLSGCGSDEPATTASSEPTTSLEISVSEDGTTDTQAWSLTCGPTGGTHPAPEDACAFLAETSTDPFAPVSPDMMCTEIYGGPQTARVTGQWEGEEVDAEFSRTNGCEIARWDAALPLLVETGGA